jgi:EAL domain-containing protein (putative c-di-GMP-specific phosphodiesterase class I)/GGDEF domain-containing protein
MPATQPLPDEGPHNAQALRWSALTQELMLTRGRLIRRNLSIILSIATAVGMGLGSHSLRLSLEGQSSLQSPWPLLIGGAVSLALLLWLRGRKEVGQRLALSLMVTLYLASVAAIVFNGLPALIFVPALVALAHVVLPTQWSGWLSGAYLLGSAAAALMRSQPIDPQLISRAVGGSIGVMLAMQLLSRYWDRLDRRFSILSAELVTSIEVKRQQISEADEERRRTLLSDPMTGLPNSEGFVEAGQERLRTHPEAVVARLYLQQWRSSLSTLLYAEQQAMFQMLLKRCIDELGPEALISRAGMDELLIQLPAHGMLAQAGVDRLDALQAALSRPVLSGQRVALTEPVLGYARAPLDGQQLPALIEKATLACQAARLTHRDRPVGFERRLKEEQATRSQLATDLSTAMDAGQTELRFQPVLDAHSLLPRGAVSRMVWHHPVFGPISPGAARESHHNLELTRRVTVWRIQQAFSHARVLRKRLGPTFGISLSLPLIWLNSVIQSPTVLLDELGKMPIEPGMVVMEIPEEAMLHDPIGLMQVMSLMRSLGIGVALDRFGAGFSSISYLDRMALDYIKIDRSFVAQVGRNERETAVCRAIIRVAHELDIRVVAEGVKHADQAQQLAQLGCDLLRGDGLAAVMSAADLTEWVLATRQHPKWDPLPAGSFSQSVRSRPESAGADLFADN